MSVVKGLVFVLVAAAFGGLLLFGVVTDLLLVFTDSLSWSTIAWLYGVCAVLAGGGAAYLYCTQPEGQQPIR